MKACSLHRQTEISLALTCNCSLTITTFDRFVCIAVGITSYETFGEMLRSSIEDARFEALRGFLHRLPVNLEADRELPQRSLGQNSGRRRL